jgi:hypothetical protein
MKPNKFERKLSDTTPIKGVKVRELNGLTKLSAVTGKIKMNCDRCGMLYETQACWAKRTAHHYCGKGCADAAKEVIVYVKCVICGTPVRTIPTQIERVTTCSKKCSKKRRSIQVLKFAKDMSSSSLYSYGNHEKGEQIASSKLDAEKVRAIRSDTRSQGVIAEQYGISQANVSFIKRGITWRHVSL